MNKPLAVDMYCGLGGWTKGLLAAGYRVVGFDITRHVYALPDSIPDGDGVKNPGYEADSYRGKAWNDECAKRLGLMGKEKRPLTRLVQYPAQLVLQDVLTIHGSQFKDAALIVASPPCQNYSYLAMPRSRSKPQQCTACCNVLGDRVKETCAKCDSTGWFHNSKAAKELRKKWETEGPDNRLFDACFRIQREAIEATRTECRECGVARCLTEIQRCESQLMAGEYPAEMEGLLLGLNDWTRELRLLRVAGCSNCHGEGSTTRYIPLIVENVRGAIPWVGPSKANYGSFHLWGDVGMVGNRIIANGQQLRVPRKAAEKVPSLIDGRRTDVGKGARFTSRDCGVEAGTKIGGDWFSDPNSTCRKHGSRSNARKAASAMIAEIPFELAKFIGDAFYPVRS